LLVDIGLLNIIVSTRHTNLLVWQARKYETEILNGKASFA